MSPSAPFDESSAPTRLLPQLGNSEIEDFNDSVRPDNHILRLDIAMNNPACVGRRQSAGNLYRDVDRSIQLKPAAHHLLPKGLALDKLGSYEMQSIRLPEFINGENVGMIQGGSRMGFLLKAAQTAFVKPSVPAPAF